MALAAQGGCQQVPCQCWCPAGCPPGLLYVVEVDAILTLFHGKSLLWPERPGRPSGILTSEEYEDAYRGEPRAWGSPAHRRLVPGPGWVTGARLPAGYSVAVGEFNDDPKTKGTVRWARATGKVRGGGDRMGAGHTRALRCPPETSGTRAGPAQEPCQSTRPGATLDRARVGALRALFPPRRVRGGGPQQEQHEGRGEWVPVPGCAGCPVVGTPRWHPGVRGGLGPGPDAALGRWSFSVWGQPCGGCRASPVSRYPPPCATTCHHPQCPLHPTAPFQHPVAAWCPLPPSPRHPPAPSCPLQCSTAPASTQPPPSPPLLISQRTPRCPWHNHPPRPPPRSHPLPRPFPGGVILRAHSGRGRCQRGRVRARTVRAHPRPPILSGCCPLPGAAPMGATAPQNRGP